MHLQNCPEFQLFLEHIPAAIAMFDHNMRYIAASRRWLTDYGFRQGSLTGCYHYEVFPDTPEKWKSVHQRCLTGFVEGGEADSIVRSDGSLEWVKWESGPWYDQNREIGGTVFFFEVITERKRTEQAFLNTSEARFQKLLANLPGVIYQFVLRSDGTQYFSYVSPSCRELFELEPEEIQQDISCVFKLFAPDDLRGIHQSLLVSAETLQPYNQEYRIITPSGQMKWLQAQSRPQRQVNGDVIWDGVLIDITKSKVAQEESQKLVSLVENSETRYRELAQREQLLNRLTSQIRNTLDLNTILETAVQDIRSLNTAPFWSNQEVKLLQAVVHHWSLD